MTAASNVHQFVLGHELAPGPVCEFLEPTVVIGSANVRAEGPNLRLGISNEPDSTVLAPPRSEALVRSWRLPNLLDENLSKVIAVDLRLDHSGPLNVEDHSGSLCLSTGLTNGRRPLVPVGKVQP